jgi:tetratricopeptide (TPR) repeat protein
MEFKELLEEAKKLNDEEREEEVISLLTDEILTKYDSQDLRNVKAEAYYWIGSKHDDNKEYDKAIDILKKSIETAELDISYNLLGNIYKEKKEYTAAIENYLKAIKIDKEYTYPYNGLGNVYYDLKEYDKAIEYYLKAIKLDDKYWSPYYNIGLSYYEKQDYKTAHSYLKEYLNRKKEKDFYYKNALEKIKELEELTRNHAEDINKLVEEIKQLLFFDGTCITHYTGITFAKILLLEKIKKNASLDTGNEKIVEEGKKIRLSEGTYLNDTSEGRELFKFLKFQHKPIEREETDAIQFTQKPFIGSFVTDKKHDDLVLWRMYGKEGGDEAKGCAITLHRQKLLDAISSTRPPNSQGVNNQELKFYRVAYRNHDNYFIVPGHEEIQERLTNVMNQLKSAIDSFQKKIEEKGKENITEMTQKVIEVLNGIAYLFKTAEYQYEHELRLIVESYWKDPITDISFSIPKVYIELVNISTCVTKLTLGPKVDRAEEWASAFNYQMTLDRRHLSEENKLDLEIYISHLPYK